MSGPPTFLGDVNFFFLYIAIMTGDNEQEMRTKRAENAANGGLDSPKLVWRPGSARTRWWELTALTQAP